ncbi:MAG: hypothetical protein ACLFPQ_01805 [Candidatus Woesearchaeota archaeon]
MGKSKKNDFGLSVNLECFVLNFTSESTNKINPNQRNEKKV